jgi:hypothetical protein
MMKRLTWWSIPVMSIVALAALEAASQTDESRTSGEAAEGRALTPIDRKIADDARHAVAQGRRIFRFDTFGDEAFWGDTIKLHQAIEGARFGGVGPGVSPKAALAAGLKVDVDALPPAVVDSLKTGKIDLNDPANTLALLKANAVVGVTGRFDANGRLRTVGVQCALCHSTVDDSLARGIGHRLDGWANRDLNVGAIVNLAPDLSAVAKIVGKSESDVRAVFGAWGPGKFDAEFLLDGTGFRPDGKSAATLIPPAFGLAGVNLHTWTGWGSVTHWNAFVANLEMHGKGTFYDPRLNDPVQFPVAARNNFGNVRNDPDLISAKLPALHFYQLAIVAPAPPAGGFDGKAAAAGKRIFDGKARCISCHVAPTFTEPGWNMHTAQDIGIDEFQANRAPDKRYRTAPLKGLWTHTKGGFYHDGRYATLLDVVNHYDAHFRLGLSAQEKADLVEYLKSI